MVGAGRRWSEGRALLVLFVFALGLRLAYLWSIHDSPFFRVLVGDSVVYEQWAQAIRGDVVGKEVFYQAPLFPYFLAGVHAIFGPGLVAARVVQMILGAAACVLVARAGTRFFGRAVGLGAGALLAVYGPGLFYGGLIHKAALDLFLGALVLAGLARLVDEPRRRWALATGAALGALALTRENALGLFPLLGVGLAAQRLPRLIVPFLLGGALVLAPVALRNYAVGGEAVLTTSQFGANFYLGNNAEADGTYQPLVFGHADVASEHADAVAIAERAAGRPLSAREVSGYWSGRAWAWMSAHPGAWLRLLARKWWLLWGAREISDSDEILVYEDASPLLRGLDRVAGFGTLAALAAAGLVAAWSSRRRVGVLYLCVFGLAAAMALFVVFGRYRVALVPPLVLFAAVGVARLVALAAERPPPRALAGLAGLTVAAGVVAWLPTGGVGDDARRATAHYNVAVTAEGQGDAEGAVAGYRRALALDATYVQAHVNLGALLARSGALEDAIVEERAALSLHPDDVLAHVDLAAALFQSGRLDEAEPHYREALRLDPEQPDAQAGLAALLEARRGP